MPDLDNCDFGLIQNPCEKTTEAGRAQNRNWAATIRALNNICQTITGDPDDPTNHIFNNLLVRFRLTSALTQGGNATAVKIVWDSVTSAWIDGTTITVYDDQNGGEWQGAIGYEGWARAVEDGATRHSIVWMQRIAYHIWGTLTGGPVTPSGVAGSVSAYSDGVNPGSSITVYDRHGRFPDSAAGSEYQALYDFEASRYEVVVCQQTEWVATATATEDYWPAKATVGITSVLFKTPEEYTVNPATPTVAYNTFGLSGLAGDLLHLQRSQESGNWEIITGTSVGLATASQLHRIRLTANLQIGANALGRRLTFDGAAYNEAEIIRIFDEPYHTTPATPGQQRGMWSGIASMEGFARKREVPMDSGGPPEYEIVWMEQYARFIHFTLTEDMGATTAQEATASVDYAWGQGDSPGATLIVHDDQDMWPWALSGAKGTAIRNEYLDTETPGTPYYSIVSIQQQMLYGEAILQETMCPDDDPTETYNVTEVKVWSPTIFNQAPVITTVKNPLRRAAKNGEKVFIVGQYEDTDITWNVVAVRAQYGTLITDLRRNDEKKCIEYKYRTKCAIESCTDESEWTELICGEVCRNSV